MCKRPLSHSIQLHARKGYQEMSHCKYLSEKQNTLTLMPNIPWVMRTKYGDIERPTYFGYMSWQNFDSNINEKVAIEVGQDRRDWCQNMYRSKSLSFNAVCRHYNTVVKPACLYAAEQYLK